MKHDFNRLERLAQQFMQSGQIDDALKIYFFMANGDNSLDGGYVGMQLGSCYERKGELVAARYWYGRAVEENPEIPQYRECRDRLPAISVDDYA